MLRFQFPSNGKAYMHRASHSHFYVGTRPVSIPFKREGIYARKIPRWNPSRLILFQFPSNGKAYMHEIQREAKKVHKQVRFNSLQTGRHICTTRQRKLRFQSSSFNSLQTGRHICTQFIHKFLHTTHEKFQFPSNGKAYMHR